MRALGIMLHGGCIAEQKKAKESIQINTVPGLRLGLEGCWKRRHTVTLVGNAVGFPASLEWLLPLAVLLLAAGCPRPQCSPPRH